MEGERIYTAKSGNTARYRIETKDERVAVAINWKTKPTAPDRADFADYIPEVLKDMGLRSTERVRVDMAGSGVPGRARQAESIRRYLKTGEPGV